MFPFTKLLLDFTAVYLHLFFSSFFKKILQYELSFLPLIIICIICHPSVSFINIFKKNFKECFTYSRLFYEQFKISNTAQIVLFTMLVDILLKQSFHFIVQCIILKEKWTKQIQIKNKVIFEWNVFFSRVQIKNAQNAF